MSNFEKKFGKYAIPNLTLVLIFAYGVGYIMQMINPSFLYYLTLDPYAILHGQIWRIFSWLIIPPSSFDLFTIIMLFFYYSIGTTMERTLGTFRYNVYIIGGILLTVLFSFLALGCFVAFPTLTDGLAASLQSSFPGISGERDLLLALVSKINSLSFSTYYINISIFLAFAVCYPEMQVLLMFVIPIKVKWMGILDLVLMGYTFLTGDLVTKFAVGAALLNFLLFYLSVKNLRRYKPSEIKRRAKFKQATKIVPGKTRHKCAVCGQTEESNPELEFRFCSKCNGNYEYCSNHLYTHEHVR